MAPKLSADLQKELDAHSGQPIRVEHPDTHAIYIIIDEGKVFKSKKWCKRNEIKFRYGAIGEHASIAICERFHRTEKACFAR